MVIDNPFFRIDWTTGNASLDRAVLALAILSALLLCHRMIFRSAYLRRRYSSSPWSKKSKPRTYSTEVELDKSCPLSVEKSMADPLLQLDAIRGVSFETTPLLNRDEARLLPLLERTVREHGDGHRVMAQTSLGELIRPKGDPAATGRLADARASINSKRLDFAIIDRRGHLVMAIEYKGSGHFLKDDAFLRDSVKREAIRKAGAAFLDVPADYSPDHVAAQLRQILVAGRPRAADTTQPKAWQTN